MYAVTTSLYSTTHCGLCTVARIIIWAKLRNCVAKPVLSCRVLLRAGNRLFLPAVQVNVTGCFTEIFAEIIQRMFVCLKVKSHCVFGKILLSPSNQSCEDIWHMLSLQNYTICKSNPACFSPTHLSKRCPPCFLSIPPAARGNPP